MTYTRPVFKNKYYVCFTEKPIVHCLYDIKINKITRLQNDRGHVITVYVNNDDQMFFDEIDTISMQILKSNNKTWFDNDLTTDQISELYVPSSCSQNNTVNIILPPNTLKIHLDNKLISYHDFMQIISDMSYIKTYTVNMDIQHIGMYIYASQTVIKWSVKCINIYSSEEPASESKKDIEEFWKHMIADYDKTLEAKIQQIEDTRKQLQQAYESLHSEPKITKSWEQKIKVIKKIIF